MSDADRTNELREHRPERRDVLLWAAVLSGPISWALAEQLSFVLTPYACQARSRLLLGLVFLGTLLLTGAGAVIARGRLHREPEGSTETGEAPDARRRFMAWAGLWMCLGFALVILATAIPPLLLRVCD